MYPKILTAAAQPPHYGGAATFAYFLFGVLRDAGLDVHHLVTARAQHAPFFRNTFGESWWNPEGLPDVHLRLRREYRANDADLGDLVESIDPDLVIAKQHPLLGMLGDRAPRAPRWLLPSSCEAFTGAWRAARVETLSEGLARMDELFPPASRTPTLSCEPVAAASLTERAGVERADRVICNSDATRRLFAACYPEHAAKIDDPRTAGGLGAGWFAAVVEQWLRQRAPAPRPFAERTIDVLFVASRWDRGEKNADLVAALTDRFVTTHEVHVAGHFEPRLGQATVHGLVPHPRILELMADARVLVVASRLDSAPGVLYEGLLMGCNVVASRNCGNWEACDPRLVVETYDVEGFAEKISGALAEPVAGRLAEFIGRGAAERIAADLLIGLEASVPVRRPR